MRPIANGAASEDPTRSVIAAITDSLAELDAHSIWEVTGDVEMAELIGRLKSLAVVLISLVDR